ncbi:uncharacterized protein LOC112185679 [Rosa chinensis]|uniref:uncharacterized protein LOC112185679 n=1 Tax=Rosa chinensis TaxID=74649 RepID=UPI000D092B03|nr:uncharacterized protein LOC112185679 [Rosa chinensis]
MLEALQDIEIASRLVGFDADSDVSLDEKYKKLRCCMNPLLHDSEDYWLIEKYLLTTHAPTHTDWSLELEEVFSLEREGELDKYAPCDHLNISVPASDSIHATSSFAQQRQVKGLAGLWFQFSVMGNTRAIGAFLVLVLVQFFVIAAEANTQEYGYMQILMDEWNIKPPSWVSADPCDGWEGI